MDSAPTAGPRPDRTRGLPAVDCPPRAIGEALADERRGENVYARVLKDHGEVRPFSNVIRAERRHAQLLEGLLRERGLAVPAPATGTEATGYASVEEACAGAVDFETGNVALYDRLAAVPALPDDVKQVLDHNRAASLDRHKPAFERCAGFATTRGVGRGAGDSGRPASGAGCAGRGLVCGRGRGGSGCGHCGSHCRAGGGGVL